MSETTKCSKCGGEMREGEIYVNVTIPSQMTTTSPFSQPTPQLLTDFSRLGSPIGAGVSVEGPLWREYTGRETGWLIKEKERKTLSIRGRRCLECGYVELYVKEK